MTEYHIDAPAEMTAGRAIFRVANAGHVDHQLTMVPLPDGFPATFDDAFRTDDRTGVPTLAHLAIQPPGLPAVFAADLKPGRYGLLCFVVDADGVDHAHKGMTAIITVV